MARTGRSFPVRGVTYQHGAAAAAGGGSPVTVTPGAATATGTTPPAIVAATVASSAALAAGSTPAAVPGVSLATVAATATGTTPAPILLVTVPLTPSVAAGTTPAPTVVTGSGTTVSPSPAVALGSTPAPLVLVTVPIGTQNYPNTVLSDSPLGYWRATESASPFVDQTAGGHDLTVSGTVAFQAVALVPGNTGLGADFGGGSAAAASYSIPQQQPLVVEAWVRLDSTTTAARRFLSCGHVGGGGWAAGVGTTAQGGAWKFSTFGIKDYLFTATATVGATYHVVFVLNADNSCDLYVNGTFQQKITHTAGPLTSTDTVRVAANGNGTEIWDGVVQEAAVYSSLSSASIASHATGGPAVNGAALAAGATPPPVTKATVAPAAASSAGSTPPAVPVITKVPVAATASGVSSPPTLLVIVGGTAGTATGTTPSPTVIAGSGSTVTPPAAVAAGSSPAPVVYVTAAAVAAAAAGTTPATVRRVVAAVLAAAAQGTAPTPNVIAGTVPPVPGTATMKTNPLLADVQIRNTSGADVRIVEVMP